MNKTINIIKGNVTAPKGFKAAGVSTGVKQNGLKDLALIVSDITAKAAGVFTRNVVKGHSLQLTENNIKDGKAKAILINSGNANACVGQSGYDDAVSITRSLAEQLNCPPEDILFGSTGVIGIPLNTTAILNGIPEAVERLVYTEQGGHDAETAMMTTDLRPKEAAVSFEIDGHEIHIGAQCKGSGMIKPNMATMIAIITTDAMIDIAALKEGLTGAVNRSFNRVTVDGDTSVCDKVLILSNGLAENPEIKSGTPQYDLFLSALISVCKPLAKMIAADGEGAGKLIEIKTVNAAASEDAYLVSSAIANSPLVKTAIYGSDANWGRIITAAGYSGVAFDPERIHISINSILVCYNGSVVPFDESAVKHELRKNEIEILVDLNSGSCSDHIWTCDLTHGYIDINASYRS